MCQLCRSAGDELIAHGHGHMAARGDPEVGAVPRLDLRNLRFGDARDSVGGFFPSFGPGTVKVWLAPAGSEVDIEISLGFRSFEIQAIEDTLALYEEVTQLRFQVVSNRRQADLEIATYTDPGGTLGYWTDFGGVQQVLLARNGSGWSADGLKQGGYGFVTTLHEIGHALGLDHPFSGRDRMERVNNPYHEGPHQLNQGIFTTMTYNDGRPAGPIGSVGDDQNLYGWQGTLGSLDISALQRAYGANTSTRTGDDVYVLPDANRPGTFYATIWDAGGTDTIAYDGRRDVEIDLRGPLDFAYRVGGAGFVSSADGIHGGYIIADGVRIEAARGGEGDDNIRGNAFANSLDGGGGRDVLYGGSGADTLAGGALGDRLLGQGGRDTLQGGEDGGNDLLIGGAGNDRMTGGGGADRFVFRGSHGRDTIADFQVAGDTLDLRGMGLTLATLEVIDEVHGALIDTGRGMIRLLGLLAEDLAGADIQV